MQSNIYGKKSEIVAVQFLKKEGYKIVKTNYKNRIGEIDVIARDKNHLVFVEVKARMSKLFGDPREAVTEEKQQKIRMVAQFYLMATKQMEANCRFDVVAILGDDDREISHIVDAF